MSASQSTTDEVSLPRVCAFEKMNPAQRDALAAWGLGTTTHGTNGPRVTWATLTQAEREGVKSAWAADQRRERAHAAEVQTFRANWDAGISAIPSREEFNSAMVEAAKESIHFVRAFVQDELSKATTPLSNEITRLRRELADLAAAKPQPAGSVVDITKETSTLTSFERRLSRHGEHLASLETRMKKFEHGR